MNYPLDYLDSANFGFIDEDERDLICKHGALDLVLIENASELLRRAIQNQDVIENILANIVALNKDYSYIRSESFPFYVNEENKKYFTIVDTESDPSEYIATVKNYNLKILIG